MKISFLVGLLTALTATSGCMNSGNSPLTFKGEIPVEGQLIYTK